MKRHDIRLRKQEFSASRIRQYKDYKQLMRKNQRINRTKTMVQFAVAVVLMVFVTGLIYYSATSGMDKIARLESPEFNQKTGVLEFEGGKAGFKDEVISVIGAMASPVGGLENYESYLNENLQYPLAAKTGNLSGKVLIQFLVNPDSSLSDFRVLQGIGGGCDEEAIRLIKEGPDWIPASVNGERQQGVMIVPVYFQSINE